MYATMDNLLKMFKAARDTTGESSGTAPSAADVKALPVFSAVLMTKDDDPRYIGWSLLEENLESILTTKEVKGWREEFDLSAEMEVRAPYPREMADNPREGSFAIYEIVFLLGLTFHMPRLALAVLAHYQITLVQLMRTCGGPFSVCKDLHIKRI